MVFPSSLTFERFDVLRMVACNRLASPRCAFLGVEGGLVVAARRKQGNKSARHAFADQSPGHSPNRD